MTEYSTQECFDDDITKNFLDSYDLQNQSDCVPVHVTLPNNDKVLINFALWDTILDVKRYILSALQPKIENIQQVQCNLYDEHQQFETNDHSLLKHYSGNCPLQVLVNIENYEGIEVSCLVPDIVARQISVHPEQGNILDTNAIMPKHVLGYKNKKTGKFYRNTMAQTLSKPIDFDLQKMNAVAIQTTQTQDVATEVVVECGSQTQSINFLRSFNIVREINCRPRIISDPVENRDKYARVIQLSVRKWIARKKFENMLKYYYYQKELTCNEEKNLKNMMHAEQKKTLFNSQHPTKTKHFEALYSVIHNDSKIDKTKSPKPKKIELLEKELVFIREIMKRRNQAKELAEEKKMFGLLDEISQPIVKMRKNGEALYIETPETKQAKQFMDFYIALKKNVSNKSERIELLLKLRETLECFKEIDLTKPLIDLITRELTILNIIQLNNDQLKTLRKRMDIEFQRILKQPDINPAIAKKSKTICLIHCFNCRRLKSVNKFVILYNLNKTTMCTDCKHLYRISVERINLMPHENILTNIKATETKLNAKSSVAFLLSVEDIYYLVTIIWEAKSAISESKDILLLRLVRWCNKKDWSPSNTILLTIEEAYMHSKIRDVNEEYSTKFINEIQLKHKIANKYFKGLTTKTITFYRNNEISKYNYEYK